jgi:hypothetical protein
VCSVDQIDRYVIACFEGHSFYSQIVYHPEFFERQFEVSRPSFWASPTLKVDSNGSDSTEELEPFSLCVPAERSFPISDLKCETTSLCQILKLFQESVLTKNIDPPPRISN